jgi:hypothetical protein
MNAKQVMKSILPEPSGSGNPFPQVGGARKERDVQTIFPLKNKPQQVKDHEERKR